MGEGEKYLHTESLVVSQENKPETVLPRAELIHTEEEVLSEYKSNNDNLSRTISSTEGCLGALTNQIHSVRETLELPNGSEVVENTSSVGYLKEQLQSLAAEKIKASSNYPGNWTNLLMQRMLDPITKQKFIKTREASMIDMKTGEPGPYDKPKAFSDYYQKQIDEYDDNISYVFNRTNISEAKEGGKKTNQLGMGNYGEPGTVFIDAVNGVEPLTPRQKDIINSHEKGHGLRDFYSPADRAEVAQVIDSRVIAEAEQKKREGDPNARFLNYLNKPEEIVERMSQLKNYYGFSAQDIFTLGHLEYARKNYVSDTGLDNQISVLMEAVTPETVSHFLKVMNEYPI